MNHPISRRHFLLAVATLPWVSGGSAWAAPANASVITQFQVLEPQLDGRLGVFVQDTGSGTQLTYRADERFPLCSTFKVFAAAALLKHSMGTPELMQRVIQYQCSDLVSYSPITERHIDSGMTVAELCAAASQYSDNSAGNMLLTLLGGPLAVTDFAHSIGDTVFRLDRWETALNSAIPGDPRDTSTSLRWGLACSAWC